MKTWSEWLTCWVPQGRPRLNTCTREHLKPDPGRKNIFCAFWPLFVRKSAFSGNFNRPYLGNHCPIFFILVSFLIIFNVLSTGHLQYLILIIWIFGLTSLLLGIVQIKTHWPQQFLCCRVTVSSIVRAECIALLLLSKRWLRAHLHSINGPWMDHIHVLHLVLVCIWGWYFLAVPIHMMYGIRQCNRVFSGAEISALFAKYFFLFQLWYWIQLYTPKYLNFSI